MKRTGFLINQIAAMDNLLMAFSKAQKGKYYKKDVMIFRQSLHGNLEKISHNLLEGNVHFGEYTSFYIFDPKKRLISAARFEERLIHHAIMNCCEPLFERVAIFDTYANRVGKGVQAAVKRSQQFSQQFLWCLKFDIRKYYDSIDHKTLMSLLERLVKDEACLSLFYDLLESYNVTPGKGLPIGNLTSQFFANYYLGMLDRYVQDVLRVKGYVRYMDDVLLWAESREILKKYLKDIRIFLQTTLQLTVKDSIMIARSLSGINFCGYRVYPDHIGLTKRSKIRFKKKFRLYEAKHACGEWDEQTLIRHVDALIGFTKTADAVGLRRNVIRCSGYGS